MQAVLPMREREGGEEEKIVGREKDSEQREQTSERRIVDCGGRRRTEIAIVSRTMRLSATSPLPPTLSLSLSRSLSLFLCVSLNRSSCMQTAATTTALPLIRAQLPVRLVRLFAASLVPHFASPRRALLRHRLLRLFLTSTAENFQFSVYFEPPLRAHRTTTRQRDN